MRVREPVLVRKHLERETKQVIATCVMPGHYGGGSKKKPPKKKGMKKGSKKMRVLCCKQRTFRHGTQEKTRSLR